MTGTEIVAVKRNFRHVGPGCILSDDLVDLQIDHVLITLTHLLLHVVVPRNVSGIAIRCKRHRTFVINSIHRSLHRFRAAGFTTAIELGVVEIEERTGGPGIRLWRRFHRTVGDKDQSVFVIDRSEIDLTGIQRAHF